MSKPLVYVDQNIIGLQLNDSLRLKKRDDLIWVYSKEHFSEIRRSNAPDIYLKALEDIDAKLLNLELNEKWQITDSAKLIEYGTPSQHYNDYIDAIGDVEFDDSLFDPFQVWVNGGDGEGQLELISERLAEQIMSLTSELPFDTREMADMSDSIRPEFDAMIEEMMSHGNDIRKTREAFGDGKGAIGGISGDKQIEKIWEIVSPSFAAGMVTSDQFFGFDPIEKQGYESWPIYLGIVGCCGVLDILGFQAEKKCRKLNKIARIQLRSA